MGFVGGEAGGGGDDGLGGGLLGRDGGDLVDDFALWGAGGELIAALGEGGGDEVGEFGVFFVEVALGFLEVVGLVGE
ncbi:MAG: hypothetical protein RL328_271, partial [Acidobacteriota bacterium]